MPNVVTNVSVGKPKIGGAVYRAPLGTTLPTDATSELPPAFKALGYVSEDGVTNSNTADMNEIKAWGGDVVIVASSEKPDNWTLTLIEGLNIDVLKTVYGDENVSGSLDTGITITANSKEVPAGVIVIDMMLREGAMKRVVMPIAKVGEVGDITYADDEVIGYETTFNCLPDEPGNTHYEYIVRSGMESE